MTECINGENTSVCSICLNVLHNVNIAVLHCSHKFHADCIMLCSLYQTNRTCPLCRDNMISDESLTPTEFYNKYKNDKAKLIERFMNFTAEQINNDKILLYDKNGHYLPEYLSLLLISKPGVDLSIKNEDEYFIEIAFSCHYSNAYKLEFIKQLKIKQQFHLLQNDQFYCKYPLIHLTKEQVINKLGGFYKVVVDTDVSYMNKVLFVVIDNKIVKLVSMLQFENNSNMKDMFSNSISPENNLYEIYLSNEQNATIDDWISIYDKFVNDFGNIWGIMSMNFDSIEKPPALNEQTDSSSSETEYITTSSDDDSETS